MIQSRKLILVRDTFRSHCESVFVLFFTDVCMRTFYHYYLPWSHFAVSCDQLFGAVIPLCQPHEPGIVIVLVDTLSCFPFQTARSSDGTLVRAAADFDPTGMDDRFPLVACQLPAYSPSYSRCLTRHLTGQAHLRALAHVLVSSLSPN
jgi:hypothetical protein